MPIPTKRSVLDSLTKARLVEIAKEFDVAVAGSKPKSDFVEAIAGSRRASFEMVLAEFNLDELKQACRDHGLDDRGRKKLVLVDRLMGRAASAAEDAGPQYAPVLLPVEPAAKPRRTDGKREGARRTKPPTAPRLDAANGDEARWASSTKMRLSRFALDAAAGYRGADWDIRCARDLIHCFGWGPEELPAEIPAIRTVVGQGVRSERRLSAVLRERRAVVEVIEREQSIQEGWTALLPVILQLEPVQYVVVTNQRDIALYDLRKSRTEPRLSRAVDELPKYSEAFPFLARDWLPGATPQIINVDKVSKEVADLVARVYRSFKAEHPSRGGDVIRFTLQCILAMFAEDIGLLPQAHFTSLLYQAAERGNADERLAELFRLMSTPGDGDRAIRYFNGGLFSAPVSLPVNRGQLAALTKAAEANWTHVDPHIFGSVFQGIMDDAERDASGAHYTAKDDIMRVVGPTIVEPWRKRISAASTLTELRALRAELVKFRVLDPACGSGNFLYVSFREIYRLENEILARMHEFAAIAKDPKLRGAWGSGIPTTNFYGIEINAFAVELARATLNIAKKIAFEERRQFVADRFGQVELELDPSLPLDNLEQNIVCKDALFTDWPEAEAIVGNPPFITGSDLRSRIDAGLLARLRERYSSIHGRADFCTYWFRRAHEHLSASGRGGRCGLIATNSIREGFSREASLDYIVANNGTITNAVSSQDWPGEATVKVSMVNWTIGDAPGPHTLIIDGKPHQLTTIPSHLQLHFDISSAKQLPSSTGRSTKGIDIGTKSCQMSKMEAAKIWGDSRARPFLFPVAQGKHLLAGRLESNPDYIVDMSSCSSISDAKRGGSAYSFVLTNKLPAVTAKRASFEGWEAKWWQAWRPRREFFDDAKALSRIIACSKHAARSVFVFLSRAFLPTDSLQLFAFDDDYSFGVLQSEVHWRWAIAQGSKIKEDIRYTANVWQTFPWPQQVPTAIVAEVGGAAQVLRETRRTLMRDNNWSLRALYQAAEVAGPHPLKDAQARLDGAVAAAYDLPTGQEPMEFLLELNLALAEDEAQGRPVQGPGLPAGLDPRDPRWTSTDCIQPPPLDGESRHGDG